MARRVLTALLCAGIVCAIDGMSLCSGIQSARADGAAIKIGMLKVTGPGPAYIAEEKGYFASENVKVEFVFFEAPQPISVATASGAIDFAVSGLTAGFYNLAGQGALRIIAGSLHEAPGFQGLTVVVSNRAHETGLTSLHDLAGHSLAVSQIGDPGHYSLSLIAEKYRFDLEKVRLAPLQSPANAVSAVVGGQQDLAVVPNPIVRPAIERGDLKQLAMVGDEVPWQIGAVWTAKKTANDRRDLVERFLRAYRKGARDYHDAFTGPGEKREDGPTASPMREILSKYTGLPIALIKNNVAYNDAEGRLDVRDVLRQVAWYKSRGMVKPEVDGKEIIDNRYVIALP